jgi:hypothetical protein
MTVHALLVGIDAYDAAPLRGAVADVREAAALLTGRVPGVRVRTLLNGEATLDAVRTGLREHLGRAGPGDLALLWFSGHGGQVRAGTHWRIEASGWMQTLVCADSRRSRTDRTHVPDLTDKELDRALTRIQSSGADVVAVLDCCYAGGATRDAAGLTVRGLGPGPGGADPPVDEEPAGAEEEAGERVVLAACLIDERAYERRVERRVRGVFSHALIGALRVLAPEATYRELLGAARGTVQDAVARQTPALLPETYGPADRPFLGGELRRPATFRLRRRGDGWEVDAGVCHGLPADGEVWFAVPDREPGLLRAGRVGAVVTSVDPVGWRPDGDLGHSVVLARLPAARCPVQVGGDPDDDPFAVARVRAAIERSGPGGGPPPDVDLLPEGDLPAGEAAVGPLLRVAASARGPAELRVLRADGTLAAERVPGHDDVATARVATMIGHIARWHALRGLVNPVSGLAGAVAIEVLPVRAGEREIPEDREPLRPDRSGEIVLPYRRVEGRSVAPRVFVRVRNASPVPLWCVLIDLTDRYGADPDLLPGVLVAAGGIAPALDGRPIRVALPPVRPVRPGAEVRDWLKLVVAPVPLSLLPFQMAALDEPVVRSGADRVGDERLRHGVLTASDADRGIGTDWATAVVPLVARVPGG